MFTQVTCAVRNFARATIRWLYWTTDASTYDPMLRKGLQRAWFDGLLTHTQHAQPPRATPSDLN